MAAHGGLHFGTQIVFTYGPLGFLLEPWLWYGNLATLAFLFSSLLQILLAVSIVYALRRTLGALGAGALATVVLLATTERDVALGLAAIWCLIALSPDAPARSGWIVAFGGAVLGAAESLVELQTGPPILIMCLVALLVSRHRRTLVPVFLAAAVGMFLILWFATGQALGNLPAYLSHGEQIVSGYSEAMGLASPTTATRIAPIVIVGMAAALVAAAAAGGGARRERIGRALVVGVVAFVLYKEAVVRAEVHHETIFFSTVPIIAVAFIYGRRRALAAITVLVLSALAFAALPGDLNVDLNPITHVQNTYDQVRTLLSHGSRARIEFFYEIAMGLQYKLDRGTLSLLRGQTVQVDPWETSVVWLEHLDWDPLPVFQGYSAYTPGLDRLDASKLMSATAPTRILRENTALIEQTPPAIDSRLPAWDPPATTLAMLCRYVALHTTARWQVLGRTSNRCGQPRPLETIETRYGTVIHIPAPNSPGILYAKVQGLAVSGIFERALTLFYRAKFRYAIINGGSKFRVVPGTAGDGLLLDAPGGVDYPAPFALSPHARTIEFTGPSGPLRIVLEWMPVKA